ncbi:arginase [Rhizobium sp. L1K21]|uniref:arginase n=1 Tax=Rhizobium sp. L1K21 TaxID=2954933 RepID=UPI002093C1C5|nr:arginase [Rhizobium sp. L1K21]MCO6186221.1 arginase [Rhizobium sp. L1K21]
MENTNCILLGAPVESGAGRGGCAMGPAAYRTAGLPDALRELGHRVEDRGDIRPAGTRNIVHGNTVLKALPEYAAWTEAIAEAVYEARNDGMPILAGGDHSIAAGSVTALARHAAENGRPFFVLWLDAHPDFHTFDTTTSGNLHGTPMAYASGLKGFGDAMPKVSAPVKPDNICMMGIRSVDPAERKALSENGVTVHDMRAIDEHGVVPLLRAFLETVEAAGGDLHVSLDVDFLDPAIAPAVGTTVPGGASFREAHLIMEMLHDSGLVTSLDLVELNPFLDERGRTAMLMTDLAASLMGKRVMDRPTRSF